MPLIRRSSSVKLPDTRVPVLSRRSTSVLSNGDVPKLKRKSSRQKSLDDSPELKRKKRSERESTEARPPALGKKTSSVGSNIFKPPSIVRKASSVKLPAKRVRKPKKFFEIVDTPTVRNKSVGKSKEKVFLYFSGEYLALRTDDGKFWLTFQLIHKTSRFLAY